VIAAAADSGDATAQEILVRSAQEVSSLVAEVADACTFAKGVFAG